MTLKAVVFYIEPPGPVRSDEAGVREDDSGCFASDLSVFLRTAIKRSRTRISGCFFIYFFTPAPSYALSAYN